MRDDNLREFIKNAAKISVKCTLNGVFAEKPSNPRCILIFARDLLKTQPTDLLGGLSKDREAIDLHQAISIISFFRL